MRTIRRKLVVFAFLLTILAPTACSAPPRVPDLGGLYSELAQNEDPYRNPVILIPGILGSKLVDGPPESLHLYLVAGDAEDTDKIARVAKNGKLNVTQKAPGDSVVLRSSALMDERGPDRQTSRLISPIGWQQVLFLFSDHRNITDDPAFTDNLLYILLESPRN